MFKIYFGQNPEQLLVEKKNKNNLKYLVLILNNLSIEKYKKIR
jgi:hypothetical protein